tara:strand:- start:465 stop:1073 length:609 start_codon:yes stop_codon:yes gene_type:complete
MAIKLKRSSTANKRPIPSLLGSGEPVVNTNEASPALFFKDTNGNLVKVGPVHIGTNAPNSSPASTAATALVAGTTYQILTVGSTDFTSVGASNNNVGTIFQATGAATGSGTVSGQQGVEKGEEWLDTSTNKLKIYNGSAWVEVGGGGYPAGGGSDEWALEHDNTVTTSYSIGSGKNVVSAGPVSVNASAVVTVPATTTWVII